MRGVYLSAAGLLAEQTRAAAAGRWLNNLETPGFKGEVAVLNAAWQSYYRADGGAAGMLLGPGPGLVWASPGLASDPGVIRSTGVPTDLAIQGPGYFVLAGEDGTFLTRNGCFQPDSQGYLAGAGGRRVLGMAGPIHVDGTGFTVTPLGEVYVGGTAAGRLRLEVPTAGPGPVLPGGLYARGPDSVPAGGETRVFQGGLEFTGRDPVEAIVSLMTALRSYEAAQRATRTQDEAIQKLLEHLGNI